MHHRRPPSVPVGGRKPWKPPLSALSNCRICDSFDVDWEAAAKEATEHREVDGAREEEQRRNGG